MARALSALPSAHRPLQVLAAGFSKVACDFSNRLCQWNASYAFGGTVLGDLVSQQEKRGESRVHREDQYF